MLQKLRNVTKRYWILVTFLSITACGDNVENKYEVVPVEDKDTPKICLDGWLYYADEDGEPTVAARDNRGGLRRCSMEPISTKN